MSRIQNFLSGMASSYAMLVGTALYSFAAIPLALHYLGKEQFGLWALMLQLAGYLQLVDLGVSLSLPRLIIEYKDQRQSTAYGSMLLTSWLMLLVPAVIIFTTGIFSGVRVAEFMNVPEHLRELFAQLFYWQCALAAAGFGTRIFGSLLIAHQRIDFFNYSQLLYLGFNFPVLWIGLALGGGILTYVWAQWIGVAVSAAATIFACRYLKIFPSRGLWGCPSWAYFRPVFQHGKDLFLVSLGTQLILASQTIIIARFLSLEASAVWAAGSRVFQLTSQVTWRIFDVCCVTFAEMMVRGELDLLKARYRDVLVLTASLGSYAAVGVALCNSSFVTLWTDGRIAWPDSNDILLAVWLVLLSIGHCHKSFILLTKQIGFMRYIYFVEGLISVLLASVFVPWGGIPAMIAVSILLLMLDFSYVVWRVSRYFDSSFSTVAAGWIRTTGSFLVCYVPVAAICFLFTSPLTPSLKFIINLTFCLTYGCIIFLRTGLPKSLQIEIAGRVPARLGRILCRAFAVPTCQP